MKPGPRALLSSFVALGTTSALSLAELSLAEPATPPPATATALPTATGTADAAPEPAPESAPGTEAVPAPPAPATTAVPAAPEGDPAPPASAPGAAPPPAPAPAPSPPAAAPAAPPAPAAPAAAPRWSWAEPSPAGPEDQGLAEDEERQPARVPWKGTSLIASHTLTTSLVGVGADYQSRSHQVYAQGYGLLLNYFLYEREGTSLRVAVTPGIDVELTNSDDTDERREIVLRDLPLTVAGATPLYAPEGSLFATSAAANLTTFVATSKYTRGVGDIATFSPRLSLVQSLPLLGKEARVLRSVQLGVGLRYDHLWSEADVQVSDDLRDPVDGVADPVAPTDRAAVGRVRTGRALQDGAGNTAYSDVLSGVRQAPNSVRATAFVAFSERLGIPVEFAFGVSYGESYLPPAADTEILIDTGAVELPRDAGRQERRTAGVSAGVTLFPMSELGIALGYENAADLDGPSPNLWYTPRAVFTGSLVLGLDALYERATGPARTEPFMLF